MFRLAHTHTHIHTHTHTHTHTRREGESSSGSEGSTPTGSATSSRPEFPQVKMHARNQEILAQVLTQDKEKVQHHCGHDVMKQFSL